MNTQTNYRFIRIWEVSFLLLIMLLMSSVYAYGNNEIIEKDGKRFLRLSEPVLTAWENPVHMESLSEYAYEFCSQRLDTDKRMTIDQKDRYHRILAVLEYNQGNSKEAQQHLDAIRRKENLAEEKRLSMLTLSALLKAEEASNDIKVDREILIKQALYSEINTLPEKQAKELIAERLQQVDAYKSYNQIRLALNEQMLNAAMDNLIEEEVLFDLVALQVMLELRDQCETIEREVFQTWMKIHS